MCIYLHITVFTYLHMHHHTPYYRSLEYNPHQTYYFFSPLKIFSLSVTPCVYSPSTGKTCWQFCIAEAAGSCFYKIHMVLTWSHGNPRVNEDR